MKLPNGESAIIEIEKLRDYCLNLEHPRGQHKARVFSALLGIAADDADVLRAALLRAAMMENAKLGVSDQYGTRYIIDFQMRRGQRMANVRSCWIVRKSEVAPRFVTC